MIERILKTSVTVSIPTHIGEWTDELFMNRFGKSITAEMEAHVLYAIVKSMNDGDKAKEYKISITVEKSDYFKTYSGRWTE